MKHFAKITSALLVAIGIAACGGDDDDPTPTVPESNSIYDIASGDDRFDTLQTAIEAASLRGTLDGEGTFTVFAPTDDAFDALPEGALEALLDDTDALRDLLLYHVITGAEVDSAAAVAAAGTTVEMSNEDVVGISLQGDDLFVNTSLVTVTDIEADNGVIHVIDMVLMPPADAEEPTQTITEIAAASDDFETLVAALQATGLDAALDGEGMFTVFAPTDDAFEFIGESLLGALLADTDALTALLQQHVLSGVVANSTVAFSLAGSELDTLAENDIMLTLGEDRMLNFGTANIVMVDIPATNGVIHVIDTVVIEDAELPRPEADIPTVATGAEQFSTLVTAIGAAGLGDALAGDGPFTVFAPTNAAFDALPEGVLDALLADTEMLTQVLLYHVISGAEVFTDAAKTVAESDMPRAATMADGMAEVVLTLNDDGLLVNTSAVSAPNILASNGVIHTIDHVLIPPAMQGEPMMNIAETAVAAGNFTTLVTALEAAQLVDALSDESQTYTVFAPTDAAFEALPEGVLDALLADTAALTTVLQQHVVAGAEIDSLSAFEAIGSSVETLSGTSFEIGVEDGSLTIGGVTITTFDIYTSNGVIHVIDSVIVGDVSVGG